MGETIDSQPTLHLRVEKVVVTPLLYGVRMSVHSEHQQRLEDLGLQYEPQLLSETSPYPDPLSVVRPLQDLQHHQKVKLDYNLVPSFPLSLCVCMCVTLQCSRDSEVWVVIHRLGL